MSPELAAIVEAIDIGYFKARDELVALLQARRAEQLEALAAPIPGAVTVPNRIQLRFTQRHEIALCEQALTELAAPFVAPNLEEDA